jgi:subtilisin family serine protease
LFDVFGPNAYAAYKCRDVGAKIISMSLDGPDYSDQENSLFAELYNFNGILAVGAAGNDSISAYAYGFPASYDNVLSVGATKAKRWNSFRTSMIVLIYAPGVDVLSTLPSNDCKICLETDQFTYWIC